MAELGAVVQAALNAADKLEEWTRPEKVEVEEWRKNWDTTVYRKAKGIVCIISPWNYPCALSLLPLVGAIVAGCAAAIKPSELSSCTSTLLATLFPQYLDPSSYSIINGSIPETTKILSLKWNHIFFAGGIKVGRVVAEAAAKWVCPLTLELGGKSPVWVDGGNTELDIAARRILWGKQQNTGQLCVSPDYVLIPRFHQEAFIAALAKAYKSFWPDGPLAPSSDIGKIVNEAHYSRIVDVLKRTKGEVVLGGKFGGEGERRLEVTVVKDVGLGHSLMEDEIFGPVLPIIPIDGDVDEALSIINNRPTGVPLVIYIFSENEKTKEKFVNETDSGTFVMDDTFQQLAGHEMPFGGHGESGYGGYLGIHSFDTFTHQRSFINVPFAAESVLGGRYPPYSEQAYAFFSGSVNVRIPEV
ncbi:hypothetical protein JAAARDRAFT_62005 [Jaapia argillacea MUCL 33604]|uniref:Aldehyde dehydrogenase n=1 Tax=Jaapia argillacea MUCL 33604 TaxID=933084 RepID=A0A067PM47_9AGAM|nr:hypothetical protein JAAARDRAFT_62005 [Jaapia argillacea MUCL 33604]